MRLCLSDADLTVKTISAEACANIRNIGFSVVGVECESDATDSDISRAKDILAKAGLEVGPTGLSAAIFRPNKTEEAEQQRLITKTLVVAGKMGCTSVRYSVGSMHPDSVWLHHPLNHTQKALDMVIESTKKIVPIAEDNRVVLCPETTLWTIVNTEERMKEYVDRLDSPYAKIIFDFANHMTYDTVYESGAAAYKTVAILGDRIGEFHVKDVMVDPNKLLICHIDETPVGTGLLDHEAIIKVSNQLEPWKCFSMEHFTSRDLWKPAYDHIQKIANKIGHKWTDPGLTHEKWEKSKGK
jgi:sugar phosphate isomerase/epimerase